MMGSVGVPPEELHEAFGRMPVDAPLPAVDAMRKLIGTVSMNGVVVIGTQGVNELSWFEDAAGS